MHIQQYPDYKVRADYFNAQYGSGVFNWTDKAITINEGIAEVHVVSGTNPVENVPVYVFTSMKKAKAEGAC